MNNIETAINRLALWVAIAGGMVLVALALMTGVSIIGRAFLWLGLKPVKGDFELIEAGMAFAVTSFLPLCQLHKGHATVTIVSDHLGKSVNLVIDLVVDILLTMTAALVLWRHTLGMLDKQQYSETTFILQFPIWWAYAASLIGLITWIVVGLWTVVNGVRALRNGEWKPEAGGASH